MALKFNRADRNYMRTFALGIGVLALITLIDIGIATWVWSSQEKPDRAQATAFAADTPALLGTPVAQNSGHAATISSAATTGAAAKTNGASSSGAPSESPQGATAMAAYRYNVQQGKSLFDGTCVACHQAGGEGIPGVFPPLRGNAAVNNADPATQIVTILSGRHGTKIGGQAYSGVMPPFGSQFSNMQIADIANYERSSWGNHAAHVTPKEIAAIRAKAK